MPDATLRIPGFANAHSHAFQRALRGRVERVDPAHPHDDFWTWREAMYAAANAVDPDGCYEVARRLYGEMVAAGYTVVGEFHYPHHQPGGTPYPDRNAMAKALRCRRQRRRHRDRAADVRLRPGGRGAAARGAASGGSATHGRRVPVAGGGAGRRVPRRPGAAQRPRAAPRLAGGDRRLRARPAGWSCTSTPTSSGARSTSAWPSTACDRSSCSADIGLLTDADDGRARDARDRPRARPAGGRRLDGVRVPDHRGEPGRRLPARPPAAGAGDPGVHRHRTRTR